MDTVMKTDMIVIGIFIAVTVLVVAIFVTVMLMDRYKKKRKTERSNGVMTEQEKEELRRRIEARKRREAAGTVNNNQQTCSGCRSVIPANYDVCPICGEVLRQGVKPKQQIQSNDSDKGQGLATASLVLGIVGVALSLLGLVLSLWMCIPGLICGIAGLVTAKKAKKNGCVSGIRTAGFILSIIAVVLGGIGLAIMIFRIVVLVGLSATFGNTSVPDGTKTIDQLGGGTGFGGVIQPWLRI